MDLYLVINNPGVLLLYAFSSLVVSLGNQLYLLVQVGSIRGNPIRTEPDRTNQVRTEPDRANQISNRTGPNSYFGTIL